MFVHLKKIFNSIFKGMLIYCWFTKTLGGQVSLIVFWASFEMIIQFSPRFYLCYDLYKDIFLHFWEKPNLAVICSVFFGILKYDLCFILYFFFVLPLSLYLFLISGVYITFNQLYILKEIIRSGDYSMFNTWVSSPLKYDQVIILEIILS